MLDNILPRNLSIADRTIRVLAGLAVLSLVFVGPETAWGYLGLVPLVTGLVGRCPLYTVLGVSTLHRPLQH
jgi:hypothetical protein